MKHPLFGRRPETLPGRAGDLDRSTPYIRPKDSELFPAWEKWNRVAMALIAAGIAGIAAYSWLGANGPADPGPRLSNIERVSPENVAAFDPAVSADGATVAYVAGDSAGGVALWIRHAGEPPRRLTGAGVASSPDLSADGRRVVFAWDAANGGIYRADAPSWTPKRIADGEGPRLFADSRFVAFTVDGGLRTVPIEGGEMRRLQAGFDRVRRPVPHDDGRHILFEGTRAGVTDWWIDTLDDAPARPAGAAAALARLRAWEPPHSWSGGTVHFLAAERQRFDLWQADLAPGGRMRDPVRLSSDRNLASARAVKGRVVFGESAATLELRAAPFDPRRTMLTGPYRKLLDDASNRLPAPSGDGGMMAYVSDRSGLLDLWVAPFDSGVEPGTAFTGFQPVAYRPLLSHDGSRVAYSTIEDGRCRVLVVDVRDRRPATVFDGCLNLWDWSPDGRMIVAHQPRDGAGSEALLLEPATGRRTQFAAHSTLTIHDARLAPGLRSIAFLAGSRASARLYVAPFAPAGIPEAAWKEVAFPGTPSAIAWSNARTLLARGRIDGREAIWGVDLDGGPPWPVVDLGRVNGGGYALAPSDFAMAVAGRQLVYTVARSSGSIWSAALRE